jgi:hypothetical protein
LSAPFCAQKKVSTAIIAKPAIEKKPKQPDLLQTARLHKHHGILPWLLSAHCAGLAGDINPRKRREAPRHAVQSVA